MLISRIETMDEMGFIHVRGPVGTRLRTFHLGSEASRALTAQRTLCSVGHPECVIHPRRELAPAALS